MSLYNEFSKKEGIKLVKQAKPIKYKTKQITTQELDQKKRIHYETEENANQIIHTHDYTNYSELETRTISS